MSAPAAGNPADPQRLARVVAAQVPCSRREAEQYIADGWVTVDGRKVDVPQFRVGPGQRVEILPQAQLQATTPVTMLLHKPAGLPMEKAQELLGDATHMRNDPSGIRPSRSHAFGLQALLPLPPAASGLVVFSQDKPIIRKLQQDADLLEQELIAEVKGTIIPNGLARLCRGLRFEDNLLPPARVSWQSETRLRFAVKGIAPPWIPWMCEQVGLQLVGLRRIRIGRIPMAALPAGQWRYLPAGEKF